VHGADLAIRSRRVVTFLPDGVREACIHVSDGTIERVGPFDDLPSGVPLVDVGERVILPGLVDTHVHVNEPGRTEWEGFETATRAAAAGGVTTIVDMPLNSIPPTTTVAALEEKRAAAEGKVQVDVGFWGGAVTEALGSLSELHEAGVFGFKAFLCDSGVEEFGALTMEELGSAMWEIASFDGLLIVHAEAAEELVPNPSGDPNAYATYLASRPALAEILAVERLAGLAATTGCRVHVLHVSSAGAFERFDDQTRMTAETCPHYLTFVAEGIDDGRVEYKCAPPIRDEANREELWHLLRSDGMVVSDHSPCTPDLKAGSFLQAWGGIASIEVGLRAMWTQARNRGFGFDHLARWMSWAPARVAGLDNKGEIAEGMDADLLVFDPDHVEKVDPTKLHHRNAVTPYAGRWLDGRVSATYVRGVEVYADGRFRDEPAGRLLSRGAA